MSKFQLHNSGMELLAKCGIAFEKRYILGQRTPPSARAAIGTAVDRSVRLNLSEKIRGVTVDVEAVQEESVQAFQSEWEKGVEISQEDREDGLTSAGKAKDIAVNLSGLHYAKVAPHINPTHVARPWVLDIDGYDIQLAGEIDVLEKGRVRDTKTSKKSPAKTLADESMQLSTYALAVGVLDKEMPRNVTLDYLVQTPGRGDLKYVRLDSTRSEESLNPLLARIEQAAQVIKTGAFMPASAGAWWCSAAWCPYHATCKFASKPVSVPVNNNLESQLEKSLELVKGK